MVKQIYTDMETDKLVKEIRENDPSFNLSKFFKESLLLRTQQGSSLNKDIIFNHLNEARHKLEEAKELVKYWEDRETQFKVQEKLREDEEEAEKKRKLSEIDRQEEIKKNIKQTFKEEVGREMTDAEYEDYQRGSGNIWAYAELVKGENGDNRNEK